MENSETSLSANVQLNSGSIFERWKKHCFMGVLIAINLLNYVDRYTVAGTLMHIQNTFGIGDSNAGLIVTVFVCCYMLAAPVFGYCGDRYNRKLLISLGLLIWSFAVLLSSMCENFILFLICRALVGIGEAAYATITPTIISDLFSGLARSRCLMFFYAALPIGSGLGYIIGSSVDYATGSWRWGLRLTPIVGLLLLITIFFFDDDSSIRDSGERAETRHTSFREDLKSLWEIRTFVYVTSAFTAVTFATGSMGWWTPTIAEYAWAHLNGADEIPPSIMQSIATTFGMLTCAAGLIGVVLGAMIARWWKYGTDSLPIPFDSYSISAHGPRADAEVCGFGALAAVLAMWAALFSIEKSILIGWAFVFLAVVLAVSNMAVTTDMTLYVTPPTRRATAIAIQTLCVHLLGDATSPYVVGLLSDTFHGWNPNITPTARFTSLQYALFLPNTILLLGAFLYFHSANCIEQDAEYNRLLICESNPPSILEESLMPHQPTTRAQLIQ